MEKSDHKPAGKIWHKVTMSVAKDDADMLHRAIRGFHCCGIETEDEGKEREHLEAYFDGAIEPSTLHTHMELIAELISAAGGRKLRLGPIEAIPEEDWAEEWRRSWKPVRITEKLIVCPSWERFPGSPGETVIYIYPKMAFGTGNHPTTQICLRLLELYVPRDGRVIDIGSGSGILAIAAAKLGARKVVGVEMDQTAADNARENCRSNQVRSKVRIVCGRFGRQVRGEFDLGVCNMLAHEMLPLIPDITYVLAGKRLIVSGLTPKSAVEVRRELVRHGWRFKKTLRDGEWIGFYAVHRKSWPDRKGFL
ncbi:MAG: 50S ribosomal protein L11 methyltransferase [Candidatus Hydrogenedentota bacterium]|nr:MAG: 50S ribosomal protein L11 methyltransferase [Candidatus Hydrogenedentota bacterium]